MRGLMAAIKGEAAPEQPKEEPPKLPSKVPLHELSLIGKIDDFYSDRSSRGLRPGIHPSEVSYEDPFCPRWHFFREKLVGSSFPEGHILHQAKPSPIEPSLYRIFDLGHSIHSMYQDRILGPAGILYGKWNRWNAEVEKWEEAVGFRPEGSGWNYVEPRVQGMGIRGHCDGIIRVDGRWMVLEIKSSNDQAQTFRKKVKREHLRQAMLYCHIGFIDFPDIEPEGIVFLYVNKNTSKEKEFIIPKDSSVIQDVLDGLDTYNKAKEKSYLPDRCCVRMNSKRANACPVREACFSISSGTQGFVELEQLK